MPLPNSRVSVFNVSPFSLQNRPIDSFDGSGYVLWAGNQTIVAQTTIPAHPLDCIHLIGVHT